MGVRGIERFETTVPSGEKSVELGNPNFENWNKIEADILRKQIIRSANAPTSDSTYIKVVPSKEIAQCYSLEIIYDTLNIDSEQWMLEVSSKFPVKWDSISISELKNLNYPLCRL